MNFFNMYFALLQADMMEMILPVLGAFLMRSFSSKLSKSALVKKKKSP